MTDPETRAIPVDVAELCERLRKIAAAQREVRGDMMMYGNPDPWLAEAATALETLAAENARLREALEPSGDTKAAYHGEFAFELFDGVSDAGIDQHRKVYVPWDTVKQIMAAIRARATLSPVTQESGRG